MRTPETSKYNIGLFPCLQVLQSKVELYIHIYIYAVESKLGPKMPFSSFTKSSSFCREWDFPNKWRKRQITIVWVKTWSDYIAQHVWTKFWLNLGPSFDSTFLTFLAFQKMPKPLFYSVFSKICIFKPTPQNRNTICEHNCANWKKTFVGFFFSIFCVFAVSGLFGHFSRGMETINSIQNKTTKKGNKTTRCKQQNHLVLLQKRKNQTTQTQTNTN